MGLIAAACAFLFSAVLGAFGWQKVQGQRVEFETKYRVLQEELFGAQTDICTLKLLKNKMEELRHEVDLLKTQRETEERKNAEEERRELEAERLFTEGVNNILGYGVGLSGKRDE